jgi:flagellar M-ring protein FliF
MLGNRLLSEEEERFHAEKQRVETFALIQTLVLYAIVGVCIIILIMRVFALLKPKPVEIMAESMIAGDVDDYADLLEAAELSSELEVTKTQTRDRIEEFIDNNPEAVASMLRNWLQEEEDKGW